MKALRIALKDLRLIVRDRSALASLLIVPLIIILVVAETQSGEGTNSIIFPIVNDDQGPVANVLIKTFKKHLSVREVDRATAERLVAVENLAPAMLVLPGGLSKRYLTEKASTIELLTDPAQWTELQAIKVIFLLADRDASSLGDPFGEELLKLEERSLTGKRLKFSSLEQNIPGFSVMFVLLSLIFSVSFGLRDEEVWGTNVRLSMAPVSRFHSRLGWPSLPFSLNTPSNDASCPPWPITRSMSLKGFIVSITLPPIRISGRALSPSRNRFAFGA